VTIKADPLRGNAILVDALGSALRRGDHAFDAVPGLLKRVLAEESWREFITLREEHVVHARFADFVVARPLRGIGASLDLVRRIIADDAEALDLFDRAVQEPVGANQHTQGVDNINTLPRSTGTSREQALRRLRKDAPELHADVLAGILKPHAAMVKAGLRPPTATIRIDSPEAIAAALRRRLAPEMLAAVAALLEQPHGKETR
jgi:hypothetical protein